MKNILIAMAMFSSLNASAETIIENFLPQDYYGMEDGRNTWWLQHDAYWSFSTNKHASGDYALKFSCNNATAVTSTLKAFSGNNSYAGSTVNLEAGTYTLKMKLWIASSYTGQGFNCVIKEGWHSQTITFADYEKGKWVEVKKDITIDAKVENSRLLFSVSANQVGNGNFYIDDIKLLKEVEKVASVPYTSSLISKGSSRLTLAEGNYKASLSVYVEEATTIDHFYTIIQKPYTAIKWDISTVNKGQWVRLQSTQPLTTGVKNSPFEIKIPNYQESGGGTGTLYIDKISFTPLVSTLATAGIIKPALTHLKLYPNPANTTVTVEATSGSRIAIYNMLGKIEKQVVAEALINEIQIGTLKPGVYLVNVTNNTHQSQATLVIQ